MWKIDLKLYLFVGFFEDRVLVGVYNSIFLLVFIGLVRISNKKVVIVKWKWKVGKLVFCLSGGLGDILF